jgi:hypothetical protein
VPLQGQDLAILGEIRGRQSKADLTGSAREQTPVRARLRSPASEQFADGGKGPGADVQV